MVRNFARWSFCLLMVLATMSATAVGQVVNKSLTAWLIPQELALEDRAMDFNSFNREVSLEGDGLVTVLNTTVPQYVSQLINWNPEFAYPNFSIIKGQRKTLSALCRFAKENKVRINVRFVWWGQAFQELQTTIRGSGNFTQSEFKIVPDVAQIGSTWVGYFTNSQVILPYSSGPNPVGEQDDLKWRDTPEVKAASLRYTTDIRLIFYWKRMAPPTRAEPFVLVSDSWDTILDSLAQYPIDPKRGFKLQMVMPIGITQNLLHDYVPLIWAGGGHFMGKDTRRVDFTSPAALSVPRKLMERSIRIGDGNVPYRILAFPEMSHELAVQYFFSGQYLALIEPVSFIKRWHDEFVKNGLPKSFSEDGETANKVDALQRSGSEDFWDYAGVAAPPRTFIGGSDLIVTRQVKDTPEEKRLAFALIRFLATDKQYAATLAELGTLPAQLPEFGANTLAASLRSDARTPTHAEESDKTRELVNALQKVLLKRDEQEYPALAEWPDYLESPEVLEAMQRIWRRIGEGGEGGRGEALQAAAAEAELAINKNFSSWLKAQEIIKHWWKTISLTALFLFLSLVLYLQVGRNKAQREIIQEREAKIKAQAWMEIQTRRMILVLRLFQAKMHDLTKINGTNVIEFAETIDRLLATNGQHGADLLTDCREKLGQLISYGEHLTKDFTYRSARITLAICKEMQSYTEMEKPAPPVPLPEIIMSAFEGARIEFKGVFAKDAPDVRLSLAEGLNAWHLTHLPTSMIVILQEWFYNCLRLISRDHPQRPEIEASVREAGQTTLLCLLSPISIPASKAKIISDPPTPYWESSSQGLPLIRDILWYGFDVKAECQPLPSEQTLLTIPIPLTRSQV